VKRSLAFTPLASTDIEEAYRWYEAQRPGLGDEFRAALNVIGQLRRDPRFWRRRIRMMRRAGWSFSTVSID